MCEKLKITAKKCIRNNETIFCCECAKSCPSLIILKDDIWRQIARQDEYLCLSCIESRLKRMVEFKDLKPCGVTNSILLGVLMYERCGRPKLDVDDDFVKDY